MAAENIKSLKHNLALVEQGALLSNLFLRLDIAIFEYDNGVFCALSSLPDWFDNLYCQQMAAGSGLANDGYHLEEAFPFIENFLFDAKKIWQKNTDDEIKSGIWTETPDPLNELNLEAIAMRCGERSLLLIVNETKHFDIRRKVFQRARDLALSNERLESSLYLHQRQLHLQIEDLYQKNQSFDEIQNNIQDESTAILICKQDGSVELFNKALIDIYAISKDQTPPQKSLLKKWSEEAEKQYPEIRRILATGQHWEGEFETEDDHQRKKWVRMMIAPMKSDDDSLEHFVCIANDISNIKLSEREIERLIQLDPNTHLPNRRYFWNQLNELVALNKKTGTCLGLIYLDIDHFKQVNNELGPEKGDQLLKTVANRLRQSLKKDDFVAHLGGDEFAVIIDNVDDEYMMSEIAMRIQENIARDVVFDDLTMNVTLSMGIAMYPKHGIKPHILVKNADYAMYHAKELGRNQYRITSPELHQKVKHKIQIEQGLKTALEKNEFRLLYQPQISLGSKGEFRMEALIRWHHPEHGTVSPADFISVAEESGLIIDIGRWVIETACEEAEKLNKAGYNAKVSVNVSAKQFQNGQLVSEVEHALNNYRIDAEQIELEVTESLFLHNLENIQKQLNELKDLGVTIALDDFGTGFSSLSYLKKLPIDILKIDRSFISELPDNQHSRTIVESVISMSHQLGIKVIAEGIEEQTQLDYLKELDCDYVQGFLFHAPMSSQDLIQLYQSIAPIKNKASRTKKLSNS
ncbi:putative bifunctional diguanylate cyclase/phosphodiesterase [Pleionea sediminis]|uniref:putative bifunctional diguanylate cyclase/phosphodiesterase n=1 Tax=Pleionea sediminis TaxID=2569479 RepID=UPI001185D6BE|nr:EAL domain-containing protein [Pleionea sediminis]